MFRIPAIGSLAAILWISLLSVVSSSPPAQADTASDLHAYVTAFEQVRKFQGVVLVARDGKPILEKGYGMASIELGVPNTPQTKFLIGSVTKQFTAALILQLQEQGKLDVRDPITRHLPSYPSEPGDRITIHHLLTHTSGLPSYTDDAALMARRTVEMTVEEVIATFKDQPLQFEPGTQFRYCNSGYFLLGAIIEAATGEAYEKVLQERILTPLGMTETGYAHNETVLPMRACGYSSEGGTWSNALRIAMSLPYAAGSLYSTARDLLRWDRALLGTDVLSEESKAAMFTPALENYGYGWMIAERNGRRLISHDGGIDGFTSHFARYPDEKTTIVVLCNNESVQASAVGSGCASILFGEPYDLPVIKTPASIDPSTLDDFVGAFRASETHFRVIRRDGDALYSQRTGGQSLRIYPEAKDKFYYENDNSTTVTFVRGEGGAVVAQIMRQGGVETRCERLSGTIADSLLAEPAAAAVDPSILERYVGDYELAPGFTLTFRTAEGRMFTRATGQEEAEIYPSSETEFFLKVVDARITFLLDPAGAVTGLTLHQGGRDMPARKIR